MKGPLPSFESPRTSELRQIYRSTDDPTTQRLVLEIVRLRRVLGQVKTSREIIDQAWREEVGSTLTALHQLKALLGKEEIE